MWIVPDIRVGVGVQAPLIINLLRRVYHILDGDFVRTGHGHALREVARLLLGVVPDLLRIVSLMVAGVA